MSRTRIVATIGPATNSAAVLRALARAGMNVARFNGSHADLAWHAWGLLAKSAFRLAG